MRKKKVQGKPEQKPEERESRRHGWRKEVVGGTAAKTKGEREKGKKPEKANVLQNRKIGKEEEGQTQERQNGKARKKEKGTPKSKSKTKGRNLKKTEEKRKIESKETENE